MKNLWIKWRNDFLKAAGFILIVFLAAKLFLPTLVKSGKLRGNEFSLQRCESQTRIWKSAEAGAANFDFYKLSNEDKRRVIFMGFKPTFWMKTNFVWGSSSSREIVIVCGQEFDNIPKSAWTFFLKYPSHAVGYSDGTTALISPEEFTNLNLSGFVSLSILATNSEFNIFKE